MIIFKNKKIIAVIVMLIFCSFLGLNVAAISEASYYSYSYDSKGNSIPSPDAYLPVNSKILKGSDEKSLEKPIDMAVGTDGKLYVLDNQKGVVKVYNDKLEYEKTVSFLKDGRSVSVEGAKGLYQGNFNGESFLIIADYSNQRVVVSDILGNVKAFITRPDTELIPKGVEFQPSKVLMGKDGVIYVLVEGMYTGAVLFSNSGEFLGFYGANKVEITPGLLLDNAWKQILNPTQKQSMARYVPVDYTNFDIDSEGFIYTVTGKGTGSGLRLVDQIKQINAKSINLLTSKTYGDLEFSVVGNKLVDSSFVDIAVMKNCFACLDFTRGRIFLYDNSGNLLTIFGGMGNQVGLFEAPCAIVSSGDNIYVLDSTTNQITTFSPTQYGNNLLNATRLYMKGENKSASEIWEKVLTQNSGYRTAYISIGKMLLEQNEYKEAMHYFKLGEYRSGYSKAYEMLRKEEINKYFLIIFIVIILLIVLMIVTDLRPGSRKKKYVMPTTLKYHKRIIYSLFHPSEGILPSTTGATVKNEVVFSVSIMIIWFITEIVKWLNAGFIFNQNKIEDFNIIIPFSQTILIFLIVVLANWFVCTMNDGNGRIVDIMTVLAIGLIPYIVYLNIFTILSNVLSIGESSFLTVLSIIAFLWSALLIFIGLMQIHEFNTIKNVLTTLYTIIAILIMAFLALLVWSMLQQVFGFFTSIYNEISTMLIS